MPKKDLPVKRFVVTLELEGSRVDADTLISQQALIDLFEMQFAQPKGARLVRIDVREAPSA